MTREYDNGESGLATKEEAARFLGIGARTLDDWMRRRLVPFLKIGRTVRFDLHDVQDHLAARCRVGGSAESDAPAQPRLKEEARPDEVLKKEELR